MFPVVGILLRISLVTFLVGLPWCARAQFAVYERYEDLVDKTPRMYPRFKYYAQKGESDVSIILRDSVDRSKMEVNCADVWGFAYDGMLFRVIRNGGYYVAERRNFPAALIHSEGLFYWANGAFLENTKNPQWWSSLDGTYTGFVSATPDGDVFLAHGNGKLPDEANAQAMGDRFFDDHPEYGWLQECVNVRVKLKEKTGYPHEFVMHCVTQHYREE